MQMAFLASYSCISASGLEWSTGALDELAACGLARKAVVEWPALDRCSLFMTSLVAREYFPLSRCGPRTSGDLSLLQRCALEKNRAARALVQRAQAHASGHQQKIASGLVPITTNGTKKKKKACGVARRRADQSQSQSQSQRSRSLEARGRDHRAPVHGLRDWGCRACARASSRPNGWRWSGKQFHAYRPQRVALRTYLQMAATWTSCESDDAQRALDSRMVLVTSKI
jgi:hypothetical protein